ncbi:MAG: UvrD-helicase domain-containing protein, partial [Clostridia bacterium]|nr:UvrD-helicase domain-containing protein [Clostridia bacterium]
MLELLKCVQCGGELCEVSPGAYRCACCGNLYTKKEKDVEAAFRASLGDERYARLSAARQNLWTSMHAEFISSAACLNYARELKSYAPSDYYANFAEVANSGDDNGVIDFLNKSEKKDTDKYADAVLDFLLKSLTRKMLTAVSFYIERAFEKDTEEYVCYRDVFERESEKVEKGLYEPGLPRDVFLAYSGADIMYVNDLCAHLEEQKISCFVSSKNLRHGRGAAENYDEALKTAMDACSVFVFVSSKNSRDLSCDAFKKEIPYIMDRDKKNAPPEYRAYPYDKLPEKYKTKRVEYLVDGYGKGTSSAEKTVKMFFSGLEWRQTRDEVADTVTKYLTELPDGENRTRLSDEDVRKVADAVNEGKGGAVSLEEKESRILRSVRTLLSVGDFSSVKRRLDALSDEEFKAWGSCSAAVYLYELMTEHEARTYDDLLEKLASDGRDVTKDKFYLLALDADDTPEKNEIIGIPELVAKKRAERENSVVSESSAEDKPVPIAEKVVEPQKARVAASGEPVREDPMRINVKEVVSEGDFDFSGANVAQKKAVTTTEGPVLITAGPGTGKTFTLVLRAIYLMQVKDVKAEEIFIATYTNKAANEITTRITNEMARRGIPAGINDMYIGTFHSLCLR